MPMTSAARHALAARIRLGEAGQNGNGIQYYTGSTLHWLSRMAPDNPNLTQYRYALGVPVIYYPNPPNPYAFFEDGSPVYHLDGSRMATLPQLILEYLERP